jgi:uncharacterized repeat protein (TIGR02543 family)
MQRAALQRGLDLEGHRPNSAGSALLIAALLLSFPCPRARATPAELLFEDDFNQGIPGWTAVLPSGATDWYDGPLLWQYDINTTNIWETSNIYSDSAASSWTRAAAMLINDTVAPASNFTFTVRLRAGDNDGCGLIWGYQDENNFYRAAFTQQSGRTGWPFSGWDVDCMVNGEATDLFGRGNTSEPYADFVFGTDRFFDVRVGMTNGLLSLTVVDDPTNAAPVVYPLVVSRQVPAAMAGKVGVFTWGQALSSYDDGLPSVGVRFHSVLLEPTPLAGTTNPLSPTWTSVVTPRGANGATNLTPIWSLALDGSGTTSRLREASGTYFSSDNVAGCSTNFAAVSMVAGDAQNWSNYVFSARCLPTDNDGFGLLVRYQNPTNWYRIAFRQQDSLLGVKKGMSIQRCVNGVFNQVMSDTNAFPRTFSSYTVPADIYVAAIGSDFQVLVMANPTTTSPTLYSYGPYTDASLTRGKVGLFAWAQRSIEYESARVQKVSGQGLQVFSTYGDPDPPRGLNDLPAGSSVTAWVTNAVYDQPGTRRIVTGWQGSGSVPASGTSNSVAFQLNRFSLLNWTWAAQYQLRVSHGPGGTVSYPPGEWFGAGTNITLIAQPDAGYMFTGWTGDLPSVLSNLTFTLDRPYTLTANFTADLDADGLPDDWEMAYFHNLAQGPNDDPDGDLRPNLEEFSMGTDPSLPPAPETLRITGLEFMPYAAILSISNNTGSRYNVQMATNLAGPWSTIASGQYLTRYAAYLPSSAQTFWRLQQPGRPPEVPTFVPGSWALVVLPDTQGYSQTYPELFKDQARWIVANKDRYNIKYVLHLGDIVNADTAFQWTNAQAALSLLDGVVPYALAPGNHDYSSFIAPRSTLFNEFFPLAKFQAWPTFGGVREPGRLDNSYHLLRAGGVDWLVLALEFGPRNGTVAWANQIVSNYPARKKILITHAYMYSDDTRYDWATQGTAQIWNPHAYGTANDPDGTNDGEELWQKLVKIHPNWVMTLNGHVLNDGLGRLSTTNDSGSVVHQMLVNYQMQSYAGGARLRLIEFRPDGRTVQVKAYSPWDGSYWTDPENQFTLTLDPPLR